MARTIQPLQNYEQRDLLDIMRRVLTLENKRYPYITDRFVIQLDRARRLRSGLESILNRRELDVRIEVTELPTSFKNHGIDEKMGGMLTTTLLCRDLIDYTCCKYIIIDKFYLVVTMEPGIRRRCQMYQWLDSTIKTADENCPLLYVRWDPPKNHRRYLYVHYTSHPNQE